MDGWTTKRSDWTKARDNPPHKIGKGAVSGVSIGTRIDAICDSAKKGYVPLQKAVGKLKTDLETYSAKIKKMAKPGDKSTEKYTKFADWIKNHLMKDVLTLESQVAADLGIVDAMLPNRAAVGKDSIEFTALDPNQISIKIEANRKWCAAQLVDKTVAADKKPKPADMTDDAYFRKAMVSTGMANKVTIIGTQLTKHAAHFRSYKFKAALPGFESAYQEVGIWAVACENAAKAVAKYGTGTSLAAMEAAWLSLGKQLDSIFGFLVVGVPEVEGKLRGK